MEVVIGGVTYVPKIQDEHPLGFHAWLLACREEDRIMGLKGTAIRAYKDYQKYVEFHTNSQ